jgi:hypothetical protein
MLRWLACVGVCGCLELLCYGGGMGLNTCDPQTRRATMVPTPDWGPAAGNQQVTPMLW